MSRSLLKILLVCAILLIGWPDLIWAQTPTDSSWVAQRPRRLGYRSTGETVLAAPGMLVYAPIHGVFYVMGGVASMIWEDRIIAKFQSWFTTEDGRTGVRFLSNTTSGSGLRFFHNKGLLNGDLSFTTQYGVALRQDHLLTFTWPHGRLLPGTFLFAGQFRTRTVEKFYGIGHNTSVSAKTDYLQEDGAIRFAYEHPVGRKVRFGTDVNYHTVDIRGGEDDGLPNTNAVFTRAQASGLGNRAHFIELGASAFLQMVDRPGSPTRGNLTLLRFGYNQSIDDDDFSHITMGFVTEQFLELFYRRVISLRVGTDWRAAPIGSNTVPFYSLASLGGEQVLRGYERDRFRDRGTVFSTLTYRFPIVSTLDGFLFYERGRTFNHPDDFMFAGWKDSAGGGIRVWSMGGVLFDLLVARSDEKIRVIFGFNTQF